MKPKPTDKCVCGHELCLHSKEMGCKVIEGTSSFGGFTVYCTCPKFRKRKVKA